MDSSSGMASEKSFDLRAYLAKVGTDAARIHVDRVNRLAESLRHLAGRPPFDHFPVEGGIGLVAEPRFRLMETLIVNSVAPFLLPELPDLVFAGDSVEEVGSIDIGSDSACWDSNSVIG